MAKPVYSAPEVPHWRVKSPVNVDLPSFSPYHWSVNTIDKRPPITVRYSLQRGYSGTCIRFLENITSEKLCWDDHQRDKMRVGVISHTFSNVFWLTMGFAQAVLKQNNHSIAVPLAVLHHIFQRSVKTSGIINSGPISTCIQLELAHKYDGSMRVTARKK